MKKNLSIVLLTLATGLLFGMEQEQVYSPLYVPQVRLSLADHLFKTSSYEEAMQAFKALALTDKDAFGLFKKETGLTNCFLMQLCALSYHKGFSLSLLDKRSPLLNENEMATFKATLRISHELALLFSECTQDGQWDRALQKVVALEKSPLINWCISNYWWWWNRKKIIVSNWEEIKHGGEPIWTLLMHALKLNAPLELINALIERGCPVTRLSPRTPLPCYIVSQKLYEYYKTYTQKCLEQNANHLIVEEEMGSLFKHLDGVMDLLIKAGASFDRCEGRKSSYSWYGWGSPEKWALMCGEGKMISYLNKKGAFSVDTALLADVLISFLCDDRPIAMVKAFIESCDDCFPFLLLLINKAQADRWDGEIKTRMFELVSLLLEKIAINKLCEGMTLLDMVLSAGGDEDIVAMLQENGALESGSCEKGKDAYALVVRSSRLLTLLTEIPARYKDTVERLITEYNYERGVEKSFNGVLSCSDKSSQELIKKTLEDAVVSKEAIVRDMQNILKKAFMRQKKRGESEAKSILKEAYNLDLTSTVAKAVSVTKRCITLACTFPFLPESREFLKMVALKEPLSTQSLEDKSVTSVFTYMVRKLGDIKQYEPHKYEVMFKELCILISWLLQEGVKDDILSNGKTAAQEAQEIGMSDLAQCIDGTFIYVLDQEDFQEDDQVEACSLGSSCSVQ